MDFIEHKAILTFLDTTLRNAAAEELDLEADAIIRAYFKRHPEAAYRVTKLAMKQADSSDPTPGAPAENAPPRSWVRLLFC